MNPLTLVKRIQNINKKEANLQISEEASWHYKYKDSAYVYAGGIPFDLTEGDLLAIFAQYGEIVDVNLIKDKSTGKSKGFAFVAYEDQRSTNLAVDNLNGAQILGRTIRVDHVTRYKKFEEEDEETKQRKREERGVCRAFQRGQCDRGNNCKFSHDEQRAANTGWGAEDDQHLKEKSKYSAVDERSHSSSNRSAKGGHRSRRENELSPRNDERRYSKQQFDDYDDSSANKRSRSHIETSPKRDRDRRDEMRSKGYESKSYNREERHGREEHSRSGHHRDAPRHRRND